VRAAAVLDHEINPSIAGHGGWAQLVEVEGNDVHLSLGGGCQGCGMAQVTLRHGIEAGLRHWIPELGAVLDATDHASGENPFY
jgi:Fe/S biogenesis protein NfuA